MRKFLFLLLIGFFLLNFFPEITFANSGFSSKERFLVKLKPSISISERLKLHRDLRSELRDKIQALDVDVVEINKKDSEKTIKEYLYDQRVLYVEPDYVATALEGSNDPYLQLQWGMQKVQASGSGITAWNITKSDPNVKIAILDTGIDQDHEDLVGKIISTDQKNCTDSTTLDDLYGHGTHVAGIAAAATNNSLGVAGLGYNASLMNVKVLGDNGSGYYSWIADCITWAADHGAKVINLSLGGSSKSKTLESAVNYAWKKGAVIVAAAGNSGNTSPTYPAYYTKVIAVAATDKNDQKASWSSYGRWVDVAAPGVDIYSTFPNHPYAINKSKNYDYGSGTSMATPHVAGLAALVWMTPYGSSNDSVRERIENYADKIAGTGKYWQYGRINALNSVKYDNALVSSPTITPILTVIPSPTSLPSTSTREPISTPTPTSWWCQWFPSRCS